MILRNGFHGAVCLCEHCRFQIIIIYRECAVFAKTTKKIWYLMVSPFDDESVIFSGHDSTLLASVAKYGKNTSYIATPLFTLY